MFINGSTHSLFGFTECVTGAFIGNTIPHCEPYMLNICINWISYMPAICCLLSVWCEFRSQVLLCSKREIKVQDSTYGLFLCEPAPCRNLRTTMLYCCRFFRCFVCAFLVENKLIVLYRLLADSSCNFVTCYISRWNSYLLFSRKYLNLDRISGSSPGKQRGQAYHWHKAAGQHMLIIFPI